MRGILIAASLLAACVLAAGCDEEYNPKDKECGFAGNGCWADGSCNAGFKCNTKRKGEALGEGKCPSTYGVCEEAGDSGPTSDGPGPASDGPKPDGPKPDGPKPDGPVTDSTPAGQ